MTGGIICFTVSESIVEGDMTVHISFKLKDYTVTLNYNTEFAGIGPTGRFPYAVSAGQTTLARAPGFIC